MSHFVTIGSPLGIPEVRARVMDERNYTRKKNGSTKDIRTPSIVTEDWTNFADKKDPVSLDVHLADDYASNSSGIQVVDDLVRNDYRKPLFDARGRPTLDPRGKPNPHKSYGYLRTPELSRYLAEFLA